MRNAALHRHLEVFVIEASALLSACAAAGEEIPFELREERGAGAASLYCYRPLTGRFIRERRDALAALDSHRESTRVLADCEAIDLYLTARGELRIPGDRRGRAELALEVFLCAIYAERSEFGFEPAHFEGAYAELERTVYAERSGATLVIAPLLGVALDADTTELSLGDGVCLVRGDALAGAPSEAVWGDGEEPSVLAVLTLDDEAARRGAVGLARTRFRRLLSALRLFERGTYTLGPLAWVQTNAGGWRTAPTGASGRVGGSRLLTIIPAGQQEELRAFWRLVGRRGGAAGGGELAWALARFEMGCERATPLEALTDHLLALRALLEPEGSASGRLAQRLAVICAPPEGRAALARRTAAAIELERAVITGMTADPPGVMEPSGWRGGRAIRRGESIEGVVEELSGHLRAMLRDTLCGHLDPDLRGLADELLSEAADELAPAA